jgi:multimeric flavodoxin WrbA
MRQHRASDLDLLVVYHSQSGHTEQLASAVEQGALRLESAGVLRSRALEVTPGDLCVCKVLVLCSPEYFGYMAGAVKDLFDRTYELVRDRMIGKAYAVVISAGNDGAGALLSIERIIAGFRMRKVQEPIICKGEISEETLEQCRILGQTLAAGIELGIY